MATAPATERSETSPAEDPGREAWELLSRLFLEQRGRVMAIAAKFDLAPQQLFTLKHLDEPQPMGAIAALLHCDNSNVTGIVDRLEQRGLVERRPAPHDRRVKLLVLTDEGARLRRELVETMHQPPPAIERLSRADRRALRDIMRRALAE